MPNRLGAELVWCRIVQQRCFQAFKGWKGGNRCAELYFRLAIETLGKTCDKLPAS